MACYERKPKAWLIEELRKVERRSAWLQERVEELEDMLDDLTCRLEEFIVEPEDEDY